MRFKLGDLNGQPKKAEGVQFRFNVWSSGRQVYPIHQDDMEVKSNVVRLSDAKLKSLNSKLCMTAWSGRKK